MTEPFSLHMCGWTEDKCRCFWNSQTGYKIASRMQGKRKEPSALHNEKLASCLRSLSEGAKRVPRRSGLLFLKSQGLGNLPVCLSGGQRAAAADSSLRFWLGFCPGSTAFLWAWRGPQAARQHALRPDVPWCPGWKGNQAVGLKPEATTHFSSLEPLL